MMKKFYYLVSWFFFLCSILLTPTIAFSQNRIVSQKSRIPVEQFKRITGDPSTQKLKSQNFVPNNQAAEVSIWDGMKGKQENLSLRNEVSKTYRNQDGSFTSLIAAGPIHYQKNGHWNDIDTNITRDAVGKYSYSNKANMMESYYGENSNVGVKTVIKEGELIEFLNTSMYWEKDGIPFTKIQSSNVPATVKDDELYYKNLFGNISAEFKSLTGKRKLTYVIPDKAALGKIPVEADYLVFSEDIILDKGWTYELKDNIVLIKNLKKEIIFLYNAPAVFEKYNSSIDFNVIKDKPTLVEINQAGNVLTYLLKVKREWLENEGRVYPVGIDPPLSVPDEAFRSGSADASGYGVEDQISIGYLTGDELDGFVRFDLSSIPSGSSITAATSALYRYDGNGGMGKDRSYRPGSSSFDPRDWIYYLNNGIFTFYYGDLFYSFIDNLSLAASTAFSPNNQYKINAFNPTGIANVQSGLPDGYVNVIFYPFGSDWGSYTNYGIFYGHTAAVSVKPYLSVTYTRGCTAASSTASDRFIDDIKFRGTLNPDTDQASGYTSPGYADYRAATSKAKQIPGGGINVFIHATGTSSMPPSYIKAWVDWNKDGIYDPVTEKVFDSGSVLTVSTTFGYIIPIGTAPGNYNIRLRNYYYDYEDDLDGYYYGPCGPRANGETEDYSFEVIADCAAKITSATAAKRCGAGPVTLTAVRSGLGSGFKWYASEFGPAITGATSSTYTTPSLPVGTYTYYVTATNGSTCDSSKKTPVKFVVNPVPTITFEKSQPSICGEEASLIVTSAGDKQEVELFAEGFESGLGKFTFNHLINNGSEVNTATDWQSKSSTYIPTGAVWYPAISSGSINNKFAYATSDVLPPSMPGYSISTTLTYSSATINTTGFINLKLSFDSYFSYFGTAGEGLYVEIFNGSNWIPVPLGSYTSSIGVGTRFENKIVDLNSFIGQTNLQIRFRYSAGWADGVAIDNVRLYGDKPLSPNFNWSAPAGTIFSAINCTSPIESGVASACIKPSVSDLENSASWLISVTPTLNNGCSGTASITITNNTKTWNTTTSTNWGTDNWKPGGTGLPPTADKCVIIKTPVTLNSVTNGLAKNLTVQAGGKLDIAGNLTVTDFVKNENASPDNLTVKSDGNLIQLNATAPNSGSINAERAVTDMDNVAGTQMDYVYWSSSVLGQKTKNSSGMLDGFSPGTPNNRFFRYNEPNDRFYETGDPTFVPGKGYAVQAETSAGFPPNATGYAKTYHFRGTPNNGDISFNISRSPNAGLVQHGFNLIGNPYPSNIDFNVLYGGNSGLIYRTVYFWTNNTYTQSQQGSSYAGNNYAVCNGAGGNPPTGGSYTTAPNGIIKVGQGVIIQKQSVGGPQPLLFKNSYGPGQDLRVTTAGTFYQKGDTAVNRFWIKLLSPTDLSNTQLIAYIPEASNGYDPNYDAEILGMSSDVFYSKVDDKNVLIQGKSEFVLTDRVGLGANFFKNAAYTIALDHAEGIFAAGQNIYLKDIQTGIVTNLSEGSYTFTTEAGLNEGRFEIIYKPEIVLATEGASPEDLIVYRDGGNFVAKAKNSKITKIEVYDTGGRLIYSQQTGDTKVVVPAEELPNSVYILKITQNERVTSRKILK